MKFFHMQMHCENISLRSAIKFIENIASPPWSWEEGKDVLSSIYFHLSSNRGKSQLENFTIFLRVYIYIYQNSLDCSFQVKS